MARHRELAEAADAGLPAARRGTERLRQRAAVAAAELVASQAALATATAAARRGRADAAAAHAGGAVGAHLATGAAIAELVGALPGYFHGRAAALLRLAAPRFSAALNAVLALLDQATATVAADRAAATAAVEAFRRRCAGVTACNVLAELPPPPPPPPPPPARAGAPGRPLAECVVAAADVAGAPGRPLAECVVAAADATGAPALAERFFGSWRLVRGTRNAERAVAAPAAAAWGFITERGELFKADGEVACAPPPAARPSPYLLGADFAPPPPVGAAARAAAEAAVAEADARTAAAERRIEALAAEAATRSERRGQFEAGAAAAAAAATALEARRSEAEAAASRAMRTAARARTRRDATAAEAAAAATAAAATRCEAEAAAAECAAARRR